jgi:hypothetical protein
MEEKIKFLFDKILEKTVKNYNQYNDSRVKIESTPTIDLVNKVKTHRGSKYEVYVKIPELKVFADFTHIFHKVWKTMGLHKTLETNLFINTIIPRNFDTLKYKANQYKKELQEEVDKYVKRQRVVGNEISINIDDVEVINNNWVGGYRMSFSVYATCINNGNQEEILRVDNPIIERELNYICTELLGHEYMDGIIQGYGLTVDFVKNEPSEINEGKMDDIKDFIKKNTDKIKTTFKEELKNSSDDAKTAFKHLITKKKDLTKEEREEISKELKQVFKRTAKRLGMASLFILPGGTILVILLNLFTKKKEVPYDETISEGKKVRLFTESIDNHELKWHRDREDRLVEVIEGEGWQLQFDDELPFNLEKGMSVIIPEGVYHRVIKGSGNLKVSITVLD